MNDEQPSEWKSACPHTEAMGKRWGDPISKERQAELKALFDKQREWAARPTLTRGESAFDNVKLTGADVFHLASLVRDRVSGSTSDLHLEGAVFNFAHLEGASLSEAHLERVNFSDAHLDGCILEQAHLEGTSYLFAHLAGADLTLAHLEGASFNDAHMKGVTLGAAHLEGVSLDDSDLENADFTEAFFDRASVFHNVLLRGASFDQASFGDANLTVMDWSNVPVLGDEIEARRAKYEDGKQKPANMRLDDFRAAVRANRLLAVALRAQGLNEDADRFAYRAQLLQRQVLRRQGHLLSALGSWFLDLISGYGYKPMRSFLTYILVILGFAAVYFTLGGANGKPLSWNEAIVVSMTAFHGRGFFSAVFQPGDIQAAVAAIEAFIGLLIEIVFIATFTQRFFAR